MQVGLLFFRKPELQARPAGSRPNRLVMARIRSASTSVSSPGVSRHCQLPSAVPGILSGVILSVGRIVGETAALIYTSGTVAGIPKDLMHSGRTLSVHMYALLSEGLYMNEAYATAVVLLILVLIINMLSGLIAKRITAKGK